MDYHNLNLSSPQTLETPAAAAPGTDESASSSYRAPQLFLIGSPFELVKNGDEGGATDFLKRYKKVYA